MTPEEIFQQAQFAHQAGKVEEADRLYRALIEAAPDHGHGRRLFAILLMQQGRHAESEIHMAQAAQLLPDETYMHQNHALVLNELGRFAEAEAAASRAIKLQPDYAPAYLQRGNALARQSRLAEAIRDYERAETRGMKEPALFYALGLALASSGRNDEAIGAYAKAIVAKPDFLEAIVNRGIVLQELQRSAEALAHFDRAIALQPRAAQAHNMRGIALYALKRYVDAADAYVTALTLQPDYAKAHFNLGMLLAEAGQFDQARIAYEHAATGNPDLPQLQGNLLHVNLQLCDWRDYDKSVAAVLAGIDAGKSVTLPFQLLALPSSQTQQKKAASLMAAEKCPPQTPLPRPKKRKPGRLRIAYVCKDFYDHATTVLFAEVLERHNRDDFEIFGISHGPDDGSPARIRIMAAFEHFIDLATLDDRAIAKCIHDLNIDIAIDLDGYTRNCRPAILSFRPAAVQAQFLAYPGTMAAAHIDYILGDRIVTPPEHAVYFTEKFALLPGTYQPNSARPEGPPVTRGELGLPEQGFVFGCFNNNFKISPSVFDSWMRIISRVEGSVLWLLVSGETSRANLAAEAKARGIDPARLIFADRLELPAHIARLRQMDLFLDTYIYGAHTTASDALWANVPVVTLKGEAFPARVAASVLSTLDLDELIAATEDEYENLAVALASDTERFGKAKEKIARNRGRLFDAAGFASHLEAAFHQMWARHEAGQAPESFEVRTDDAVASLRRALVLQPTFARVWFNLAYAYRNAGLYAEALAAYDGGLKLAPSPDIEAARFFVALYLCDWRNYAAQCEKFLSAADAGQIAVLPFQLLFLPSTPEQQLVCARKAAPPLRTPIIRGPRKTGRLRVAYIGKDFMAHPVTYLLTETLERHDRSNFEFFIISHGPDDGSPARKRVAAAVEHFVDVRGLDDAAIAARIAELGIDIAVDLDGYTRGGRPDILAYRPAPVQAQYLGYPGTMGADHIDYLIADAVVTPPEHQRFYSEKLGRLPGCYLPNSSRPAGKTLTRAEVGLPRDGFVFCAFTAAYKISPDSFAAWMRILARVPDSILWLRDAGPQATENLRREAHDAGIDPARLVFAPATAAKLYFARITLADLYLDTFIYGAHTTASDALWAGLPMITCMGATFARRVGASLLTAAGLDDLIARDASEYENIAVTLAKDPERLAHAKERLAQNRSRLFDAAPQHLESAFRYMWARYQAGEQPESFDIK